MKYTKYTIRITTPSGKDQDEQDSRTRPFTWSWGFLASLEYQAEAEEAIRDHVSMAHANKNCRIRSIAIDNSWCIWHVQVEWDGTPQEIEIPTLKFTGTSVHQTTGAKKRRTLHFDFEPSTVRIGGSSWGKIYRIEKDTRVKIRDDDPELMDEGANGWCFISDKLREHAEQTLNTIPHTYDLQAGFGGDEGTGLIEFSYEMEEPVKTLAFPPMYFEQKNYKYVIEFADVEWFPLIGRKD